MILINNHFDLNVQIVQTDPQGRGIILNTLHDQKYVDTCLWFWAIMLGSQSVFQFIPKVFDGVEVRALCRPVKLFHTDLNKPFLYGPHFVHDHSNAETGKGLPQTVATKLEAQNLLECHCML